MSYTCKTCGKAFRHLSPFILHARIHTGERPYVCKVCNKRFTRLGHLKEHAIVHTNGKPYSCQICKSTFRRKNALKMHERIHIEKTPYLCNTCGMAFSEESYYNSHVKIHTEETPSASEVFMENHFEKTSNFTVHTGEILDNYNASYSGFDDKNCLIHHESITTGKELHQCRICDKILQSENGRVAHESIHAKGKPYTCKACGKAFGYLSLLERHVTVHTGERPYLCNICGKALSDQSSYKYHERIHTGEPRYPRRFSKKKRLEEILNFVVPTGERLEEFNAASRGFEDADQMIHQELIPDTSERHQCKICDRILLSKIGLLAHESIHAVERPYACKVCGRAFNHLGLLKHHVTGHAAETPYMCNICGKGFREQSTCKCHERVHIGETAHTKNASVEEPNNESPNLVVCTGEVLEEYSPFDKSSEDRDMPIPHEGITVERELHQCKICDKILRSEIGLKAHESIHAEERPYTCKVCNKAFKFLSLLKRHVMIHTGEKPFLCFICGNSFNEQTTYKRHVRIHTRETPNVSKVCMEKHFEKGLDFVLHNGQIRNKYSSSNRDFRDRELLMDNDLNPDENKYHQCKICEKILQSENGLKAHESIHAEERPYACKVCYKTFICLSRLTRHVTIHTGERPFLCFICGKAFNEQTAYKRHVRLHTGKTHHANEVILDKRLEDSLDFDVPTEETFDNSNASAINLEERDFLIPHKSIPTESASHNCKICDKKLLSKRGLRAHESIHAGERPYTCKLCNKAFDFLSLLKRHIVIHTGEKPYLCIICGKAFNEQTTYKRHKRIHTGVPRRTKKVSMEKRLDESTNLAMVTGEIFGEYNNCALGFENIDLQIDHEIIPAVKEQYQCRICGKILQSEKGLDAHVSIHDGKRPYTCKVCNKAFNFLSLLKRHVLIHTGEKPYLCIICGKAFNEQTTYKRHVEIHTGETRHARKVSIENRLGDSLISVVHPEKVFDDSHACAMGVEDRDLLITCENISAVRTSHQCKTCDKILQSENGLKAHESIHAEERPYTCKVCNKAFVHLSLLKRHIVIHTGERPYLCIICGKAFNEQTAFNRHKRIHTGEPRHGRKVSIEENFDEIANLVGPTGEIFGEYNDCTMGFENIDLQIDHEVIPAVKEQYQCEICGKILQSEKGLDAHVSIHHGKMPYTCKVCNKAFYYQSLLKRHVRTPSHKKTLAFKVCHKSFKDVYSHIDHKITQRREASNTRIEDSKTLSCRKNLKESRKINTEQRPYHFEDFVATFVPISNQFYKETLFAQEKKVSFGVKSFGCGFCDEMFVVETDFLKHCDIHNSIPYYLNI